jgi:hypothetical protein
MLKKAIAAAAGAAERGGLAEMVGRRGGRGEEKRNK